MSESTWQELNRRRWRKALEDKRPDGERLCWDGPLAVAREELAREAIEQWNQCGVVPVEIWSLMSAEEKTQVHIYGASQRTIAVLWAAGLIGLVLMVVGIYCDEMTLAAVGAGVCISAVVCLNMEVSGSLTPHGRMIAPGTATTLKHIARTYEVANGMLTLAGETQGGELTVAQGGDVEMCDG